MIKHSQEIWSLPLAKKPRVVKAGEDIQGNKKVDYWCLKESWSLHLYNYEATMTINGKQFSIQPGSMSVYPPGVLAKYNFVNTSPHLYIHFRVEEGSVQTSTSVPALIHTEDMAEHYKSKMLDIIALSLKHPLRSDIRLWDLLWELVEYGGEDAHKEEKVHPDFHHAIEFIQENLSKGVGVKDVLEEVGVSQAQLTRLFRKYRNSTVIGYINDRKAGIASDLLKQNNLSVKEIAQQVGFTDLQYFNKFMRRYLGMAPRTLRLVEASSLAE